MAHEQDPNTWTVLGFTIGGILAGFAGAFGIRKPGAEPKGEASDVQALREKVFAMSNELAHMKEARAEDAATLQRLEEKNDLVIVRVFEKLEQIGLSVNTLQTQIQMLPKAHR